MAALLPLRWCSRMNADAWRVCVQGQFLNQLGALVGWSEYSIEGVEEGVQEDDADATVLARVVDSNGVHVRVEFRLKRREFGSKKGAFMTRMVRKVA